MSGLQLKGFWYRLIPEQLLYTVVLIHILVCPFTKVEESFNLQACHDILYHGADLSKYDHHEFPGVVPRTFLGPIIISAVSYPLICLSNAMGGSKFLAQFIVRSVLALIVLLALKKFTSSICSKFGLSTATWHSLICTSQFHLMFYLSRPLPNIFALALTLYALHHWLEGRSFKFILTSAAGILIFRGELALFLGIFLLMDLAVGRLSFFRTIGYGLISMIICLTLTMAVDSYFWRRLVWPEGEVLYYNVILNKSSNWGTSPWAWYFYSALPRSLFASLPLVPLGILLDTPGRRSLIFVLPCIAFITLYSFLPHKELRFIIYVIPVLNVVAAEACHKCWEGRSKSLFRKLMALAVVLHLVANATFSAFMLNISRLNYPGGKAILLLQDMEMPDTPVSLHIDVYSAQTGISRFTQLNDEWVYDKSENLSVAELASKRFTHLLVELSKNNDDMVKSLKISHDVIGEVSAFNRINVNPKVFPPLEIQQRQVLAIFRRKDF